MRKCFFPRIATDRQSLKWEERQGDLNPTGLLYMQVVMESESEEH
jgi:hypothetical protein